MTKTAKNRIIMIVCISIVFAIMAPFLSSFADETEVPEMTEEPLSTPTPTEVPTHGDNGLPYLHCELNGEQSLVIPGEVNDSEYFESEFYITGFDPGERFLEISFKEAFYDATVYVNGEYVGETSYSYATSYFDISDFVINGTNILTIFLFGKGKPAYIGSDVVLTCRERCYISDVNIITDIENGIANFEVEIISDIVESREETIVVNVFERGIYENGVPASNNGVGTISEVLTITPGKQTIKKELSIKVRNFDSTRQWLPTNPFLYEVSIKLGEQERNYRFGFEEISTASGVGNVVINGNGAFIAGVTVNREIIESLNLNTEENIRNFLILLKNSAYINTIKAEGLVLSDSWYYMGDEVGVWIVSEYPIDITDEDVDYQKCLDEINQLFREKRIFTSALNWNLSCENFVLSDKINTVISDSTEEELEFIYKEVNQKIHLWRVSREYFGVIIPADLLSDSILNGNIRRDFLTSLYNAFSPVALSFEQAETSSGRGENYKVEVALTSNMRTDLEPVTVSFILYVDGTAVYTDSKQYDSIKKFGTTGRDVVIRDFSFEMPKSIKDGTVVTIVANCSVNNLKIETSKDILVEGGEPFEASYSEFAVIIALVSVGLVIATAVIIAIINTKRDKLDKKQ